MGDCTATDATIPALTAAVQGGMKIASANKKPFTGTQAEYDALCGQPRAYGQVRYESACMAGCPVICSLTRQIGANDKISKIAGTFSGSLGHIMTGLQNGMKFSEIVLEAKDLGYTEPDPRDDLGGTDVARKALILARGMGWRMELDDVNVVPLFPDSMASLPVPEFLAKLPDLDAEYAEKVASAKAEGKVLRYAASIEDGKCDVALQAVDAGSPLGGLSGTSNLIELYTQWYNPSPLVVQGAGAGGDTTAAGVLADIVELAFH